MSTCQDTGEWITENVVVPVERFFEEMVEACKDISRFVERNIRRPVERDRKRREKTCRDEPCNWLLACLNKVFCWFVTLIERFIEFIIEVIGEWFVRTLCELVAKSVKIVVDIITTVLRFVATVLVCLITGEWRGALDSLIDFWFDLVSVFESIGVLIDAALRAGEELLDTVSRGLRDLGEWFGPLGRVILGFLAGQLDGWRQLLGAFRAAVAGTFELVTSVARLDFCAALAGVVWGFANGIGRGVPGGIGAILGIRGIRDAFSDAAARERLKEMFEDRLGRIKPADGQASLADALADAASLDSRTWGVPWTIRPRRLSIPSRSSVIDLRALHRSDDDFDLIAIAGYAPIWRGNGCFMGPRWQVVYPGTDRRVRLAELRRYLDEGQEATVAFEMVSMSSRVMERNLDVAKRKFRTLGLHLDIERQQTMPVRDDPAPDQTEFVLDKTRRLAGGAACIDINAPDVCQPFVERFFNRHGLGASRCVQPAVSVFQYDTGNSGWASVVWPWYDRPTDSDAETEANNEFSEAIFRRNKPTGATYRDARPDVVLGYVLTHELGHAFGLQHDGHDSLHYIMFQGKENDWNGEWGQMLVEYLLLGGEPRFTIDNVVRVWEWIVLVAMDCLPDPQLEENKADLFLSDTERARVIERIQNDDPLIG